MTTKAAVLNEENIVINIIQCEPENLSTFGAVSVPDGIPVAVGDRYENGNWILQTPESMQGVEISLATTTRAARTQKLFESDWTQLGDANLSDEERQAWVAYRQALRDVTNQEGFPSNVIWPEQP